LHRRTIRNYTSNLSNNHHHHTENNSSSLLLLQPVQNNSGQQQVIPCNVVNNPQLSQKNEETELVMRQKCFNNVFDHHHYQNLQLAQQIQQFSSGVEDETANLRLLVEVAVGLWEKQNRNFEYRN